MLDFLGRLSARQRRLSWFEQGYHVYVKSQGKDKSGFVDLPIHAGSSLSNDLKDYYFTISPAQQKVFAEAVADCMERLPIGHPEYASLFSSLCYLTALIGARPAVNALQSAFKSGRLMSPNTEQELEAAAFALEALDLFSSNSKPAAALLSDLYLRTSLRHKFPTIFLLNGARQRPAHWPEFIIDFYRAPDDTGLHADQVAMSRILNKLEQRIGTQQLGMGLAAVYREAPEVFQRYLENYYNPTICRQAIGHVSWLSPQKRASVSEHDTEYFIGSNDPSNPSADFPVDEGSVMPISMTTAGEPQSRRGCVHVLSRISKQLEPAN
jgi:hypothetical protein